MTRTSPILLLRDYYSVLFSSGQRAEHAVAARGSHSSRLLTSKQLEWGDGSIRCLSEHELSCKLNQSQCAAQQPGSLNISCILHIFNKCIASRMRNRACDNDFATVWIVDTANVCSHILTFSCFSCSISGSMSYW